MKKKNPYEKSLNEYRELLKKYIAEEELRIALEQPVQFNLRNVQYDDGLPQCGCSYCYIYAPLLRKDIFPFSSICSKIHIRRIYLYQPTYCQTIFERQIDFAAF